MPENQICYKKNFLTEVIARIDFLNPIISIPNEINPKFSKKVTSHFPQNEPEKSIINKVEFGPTPSFKTEEFTIWRFWNKTRTQQLVILPDAIFVSCTTYENYEKLINPFVDIYSSLIEYYPESITKRIGLRYINNIELSEKDPFNWSPYINSYLLANMKYCEDKSITARIFNTIVFKYPDFILQFKYGIHNPDYPSPIKKKIFVLDYDAFVQEGKTPEEIPTQLLSFHGKIQENFEKSIKDKLREKMS